MIIRRNCGLTFVALVILATVVLGQSSAVDLYNADVAAFNALDVAKFVAGYADDVLLIGPGGRVKGRAALQKNVEETFKKGRASYEGQVLDSGMSGDLAYVVYSGAQGLEKGGKAIRRVEQDVAAAITIKWEDE